MLEKSVNLLEELDNISKVHWLDRDDIDIIMTDFATQISLSLRIERINVWLFDADREGIVSIGEYDRRTGEFKKDSILLKKDYPSYFKALANNKIILAENIHTNRATREFDESYSRPLGIESLMDVPLRIAGELVGVICFEKVGVPRRFTLKEQSFATSVSMVLASTLEARHRRAAQHKLDKLLEEKDLLIKEINHRVKNNFAILISLLRLSKQKGKPADPALLLGEFEERIMSMTKIHDLLCETKNYTSVNLSDYLKELVKEFKKAHLETKDHVIEHLDIVNCYLPTKEAIHMGLIITEIFLNSIKYVFLKKAGYKLYIAISKGHDRRIHLKIGDNGHGFDFNEKLKNNTLGLQLIKDLADGMDLVSKYPTVKDNMYEFIIPVNPRDVSSSNGA